MWAEAICLSVSMRSEEEKMWRGDAHSINTVSSSLDLAVERAAFGRLSFPFFSWPEESPVIL